jgi:lysophospholipase L1-like esterase
MIGDINDLLGNITTALPTTHVFIMTILNMVNSAHPEWVPRVAAYNAALKDGVATKHPSVSLVDVNAGSGLCNADDAPLRRLCARCNGGSNPPCVTDPTFYDRVHPTAAGYSIMGGVIAAALEAAYTTEGRSGL